MSEEIKSNNEKENESTPAEKSLTISISDGRPQLKVEDNVNFLEVIGLAALAQVQVDQAISKISGDQAYLQAISKRLDTLENTFRIGHSQTLEALQVCLNNLATLLGKKDS